MKIEIKKILKNPIFQILIILFLLGTILHGFIFTHNPSFQALSADYIKINQDYQTKKLDVNTDLEIYLHQFQDTKLFKSEIQEKLSYYTYLEKSEDQLIKKLKSDIFSSERDQRRLTYQLKEIKYNQSIKLEFTNTSYFLNILKTGSIYYLFILVVGFIAGFYLIMIDQETGLLQLYQTTKTGINRLFLRKIQSVILIVASLFIMKVSIQLLFLWRHGFSFSLPIQMVHTYSVFLGKISAIAYLLLANILNFFLVLMILFVFLLVYQIIKNTLIAFVLVGFGVLVEFLMHQLISVISAWKLLKIVNIFYVLDMGNNTYFQYSLKSILFLMIGIVVLFLIIFSVYSFLYIKNYSFKKKIFFNIHMKFKKLIVFQVLDSYYFKKYMIVLFVLCGYLVYDYAKYNVINKPEVAMLNTVQKEYLGKIDDDLLNKLEDRKLHYTHLLQRYYFLLDKLESLGEEELNEFQKLSKEVIVVPYFENVYEEIHIAYENGATYYVDNQGVKLWLQEGSIWYQGVLFFMIVIPMILFASTLGHHLYHSEIANIMVTTKNKLKYFYNTICLTIVNAIILIIIVYLERYLKFTKFFPVNLFGGRVNQYLSTPIHLSYSGYLFMYFFQYFLILLIISLVVLKISKYLNYLQAILFGVIVTIILYFLPWGIQHLIQPNYFQSAYSLISIPVLVILNIVLLCLVLDEK